MRFINIDKFCGSLSGWPLCCEIYVSNGSIEKIPIISASGRNFLDLLPPLRRKVNLKNES